MIITNARIFNGQKFIKANTVEVRKNIIKRVYYSKNLKKGININNMILCPGFIDIHTHSSDIDILDVKNDEDVIKLKNRFLQHGTTSFLITTFYKKNNKKLINTLNRLQKVKQGARCLGVYFEGPYINKEKQGAIPDEFFDYETNVKDIIKEYKNLRIMTIAPEIKNALKTIKVLKANKIIPSFGHSNANFSFAKKSIKYGIKNVTHLFNAMLKWNENKPSTYQAFLRYKDIFVEVIADGIHVPPDILRLIYRKFGLRRIILISDKVNNKYLLDRNKKINSKLYLIDMVHNMKKFCHLSMEQILRLATNNPQKLLKLNRIGRIQSGFYADFLILNEDLHIEKIIFNGKIFL
ncbi:MAG: amidohydrolase family protein [Candidatus Goldbacteria bacterium]|nr:amidohydrolase family protein [Candidatus Goldiibacteriota bacterium]